MTKVIRKFFIHFRKSESGATLVEYGIALFVAITVGGALLTGLAGTTNTNFTDANTAATR
ncbi:Flp family type IVb pilin [Sulfitobacter sabulilitoris]|uniref:Flp family type IVb pilin n=1 Tax=Sulfitobacter sabulilitoris TaxID=2562655 RepID=A0A5S3PKI4_9RHOB|nr:Flp family type IVb pilin [Sulfitobacter sabulilitoris]TMM54766.1 Flp family type IVb pilin [Sulfitobacter sabulilitoris]